MMTIQFADDETFLLRDVAVLRDVTGCLRYTIDDGPDRVDQVLLPLSSFEMDRPQLAGKMKSA